MRNQSSRAAGTGSVCTCWRWQNHCRCCTWACQTPTVFARAGVGKTTAGVVRGHVRHRQCLHVLALAKPLQVLYVGMSDTGSVCTCWRWQNHCRCCTWACQTPTVFARAGVGKTTAGVARGHVRHRQCLHVLALAKPLQVLHVGMSDTGSLCTC